MLKILCLHGKQQNKEMLRTRLGRIPPKLKNTTQFTIIDAPHLDGFTADNLQTVRTWFVRDHEGNIDEETTNTSLQYIQNIWKESGPFDGVLGFSMGGTMAAIMSLKCNSVLFPGLRFGIFIGSPDIPVVKMKLSDVEINTDFPSLHIAGSTDNIVSIVSSRLLSDRFKSPLFVEHEYGHCIPMKPDMIAHITGFVESQKR